MAMVDEMVGLGGHRRVYYSDFESASPIVVLANCFYRNCSLWLRAIALV
jgi:hypothetical protein